MQDSCERIRQRSQRSRRAQRALRSGAAAHAARVLLRIVAGLFGLAAAAVVAVRCWWPASRSPSAYPEPARDRQPHRLPAEAADAHLLRRRRAARRVRRGAAQLRADRRDPEGDAGRGAGGRGRALLSAPRRQLRERASAPGWPTSARRAAPRAPRPSRCRSRATSICRPRKHLLARSTRCCFR